MRSRTCASPQEVARRSRRESRRGVTTEVRVRELPLTLLPSSRSVGRRMLAMARTSTQQWGWKYLWKAKDGGNNRYVLAHRVAYYLSTGELPSYLRNLCGDLSCCKSSHWWAKPTGAWKPKPKKATRGLVRKLPASDIQHIRLLDALGGDEEQIGAQFGLTKRQVAQVAMGHVRPEAGGRSEAPGIVASVYHDEFEQELKSMRPKQPVLTSPQVVAQPEAVRAPSERMTGCPVPTGRPFPSRSYGQPMGQRLPRTGRC